MPIDTPNPIDPDRDLASALAEAERVQALLEEQAQELESQAAELEATIDELRSLNDELIRERAISEEARSAAERAKRVLDAVIEQIPIGVFAVEVATGRVVLHNRRADELTGLPAGRGTEVSEYSPRIAERSDGTPYAPHERPLARVMLQHETVEQEEMYYPRPDGSVQVLSMSASPVRDAEGEVVLAVGTFQDVTARHETERAVRERESLLRGFFGAPGFMMFVVELLEDGTSPAPDYRIMMTNDAARAWLGGAPSVVGRLGTQLGMTPDDHRGIVALYRRVWTTKQPVTMERASTTRLGAWLRMSVTPIVASAGDPPRLGILMRDITRDRANEEQRQRLQHLVEHATDFIGVTSPGLELEYVNAAGLALLGATSLDAVRGRSALDLFELESRFRMEMEILPALRDAGHWSGESRLRHLESGQSIPVELSLFALRDPQTGAPVAFATVGRAIGERMRLQAELRQAQKMEAVGQLAGGIAHDFNNLLSIILSYSVLVAESMSSNDPSRADVEEIRLAGERAAALTRQLLAFSRQQVIQPQIIDLNEIVAGMQKMLRRLIGEDIELRVEAGTALGDVIVDPGQIEQVVMNLAVNSRDAMPEGGRLTIETANVDLDESFAAGDDGMKPGPCVMLAITDTGEGMGRATMSRIFEPFFTTKVMGKGTGLGLSTVLGIVKQSGGAIRTTSEPGRGTSMKVYFPRVDRGVSESTPPAAADVRRRGGTETILLVEDEAQVRTVALTILHRYGYHVLEAQSGGDALLICEQHEGTIDLLLTDVVMQRMSGPVLAERLAQVRPDMKVLFMSGYTDRAVIDQAMLDASRAFIQKPFTPARLTEQVRAVLDGVRRP